MQVYVFLASLVSSLLIYGVVYWQLRCSFSNLLGNAFRKKAILIASSQEISPQPELAESHQRASAHLEEQGYLRLLNVVYFLFVINGLVNVAKKVTSLQIKDFTQAIQIWADITSGQLFLLGCFAVLYVIALLVIKDRLQESLSSSQYTDSPQPW
ncbi:MAG: hypothetical protein ACK551_02505 [Vampirovibrionales bacterium]